MHKVTKNNEVLFVGLESKCWEWLLKNQPQSCDWAIKNGGFSVSPASNREYLRWHRTFHEEMELKGGKGYWRGSRDGVYQYTEFSGGELVQSLDFETEKELINHHDRTLIARLMDND